MRTLGLTVLVSVASVASAQGKQANGMEHNAFLRKPVFSKEDLVKQIETDPLVRKRYEAHFKQSGKSVARYARTLKLAPLDETRRYLVYNVDGNLMVRSRLLTMRKGTMVFVDAKGKPVMKRSCGNPMVTYIPPMGLTATNFAPARNPEPLLEADTQETFAEPVEPPQAIMDTTLEPTNSLVANNEVPVELTPEPIPTPQSFPVPPVAPASSFPWWTPALPIIAGGITVVTNPGGGDNPVAPVPEPGTIAGLGLAAAMLARRRMKKKD